MTVLSKPIPEWAEKMAPCLTGGAYQSESRELVAAALALDQSDFANLLRTIACFNVLQAVHYLGTETAIEPLRYYRDVLSAQTRFFRQGWEARSPVLYTSTTNGTFDSDKATGSHYGNLFSAFDPVRYYDEPAQLLRQRLERNVYPMERLASARCLDSGCGNGRYTVALSKLGAKDVWGVDFSEMNVADATKRAQDKGLTNVHYKLGNVLELPFPDNHFDFVFSNGVLHHTQNPQQGLNELLRVLKPGGFGFYYVMPESGGIHWDSIETCRVVMKNVDHGYARQVFGMLGVPANLRFFFLDHVLVPINIRYSRQQCEAMLTKAGAYAIRRLERGADIDRTERVWRGEPYADVKYGDGEHRYYFEKR